MRATFNWTSKRNTAEWTEYATIQSSRVYHSEPTGAHENLEKSKRRKRVTRQATERDNGWMCSLVNRARVDSCAASQTLAEPH